MTARPVAEDADMQAVSKATSAEYLEQPILNCFYKFKEVESILKVERW